jgi:putative addiction module killer protein
LYELRLFFGPGYRVYFGEHDGKTVLILAGGDKSTQSKDIKKAKEYWKTYLEDHS